MTVRARMVTDRKSPVAGITAQVPRALYDQIDAIAEERGITKSALVRELIEKFVANNEAKKHIRSVA
jgi:predicted DNA-binding protein